MALGERKLASMLRKVGVPVEMDYLGARYSTHGARDEGDASMSEADTGAFAGRVISLLVKTGELPVDGLVAGATVTVDGEDMRVVSALRQDDGALVRVVVARI